MTSPIDATTATSSVYDPTATRRKNEPLSKVADALNLSTSDLKTQLDSGKSLNDVATAQGVSHDDLLNAIQSAAPAGANAEKIASRVGHAHGGGGGHHHASHAKGTNSGLQDDSKLQQVSQMLDMSTQSVTDQAGSASDLVNMFQNNGVDLSNLNNVLDSGDILDVTA